MKKANRTNGVRHLCELDIWKLNRMWQRASTEHNANNELTKTVSKNIREFYTFYSSYMIDIWLSCWAAINRRERKKKRNERARNKTLNDVVEYVFEVFRDIFHCCYSSIFSVQFKAVIVAERRPHESFQIFGNTTTSFLSTLVREIMKIWSSVRPRPRQPEHQRFEWRKNEWIDEWMNEWMENELRTKKK